MRPFNIAIVSPYPSQGKVHGSASGVASYSKNLAVALSNTGGVKTYVLANLLDSQDETYIEENVRVIRCWDKRLFLWDILNEVRKGRFDLVHLQFEYFLYGGLVQLLMFLFLLGAFRLLSIPIIVTLHQVMPLSKITREFLKENGFPEFPLLMRAGLILVTKVVASLSDGIIVHEGTFKKRLETEYNIPSQKIWIVPHGIELPGGLPPKSLARERIGINTTSRVVLYIGYLSGYKGVDVLVEAFRMISETTDRYLLILGGGIHPRMKNDPRYLKMVETLKETVASLSSSVRFVGFIPEELMRDYISAADVLIFPYKVVFGSSGPMNLAFGYKKPVLASKAFFNILEPDFLFPLSPEGISISIVQFFQDPSKKKRLLKSINHYRNSRSWDKIGKRTVEVYENVISQSYSDRN